MVGYIFGSAGGSSNISFTCGVVLERIASVLQGHCRAAADFPCSRQTPATYCHLRALSRFCRLSSGALNHSSKTLKLFSVADTTLELFREPHSHLPVLQRMAEHRILHFPNLLVNDAVDASVITVLPRSSVPVP